VGTRRGWGSLILRINRATAQPVFTDKPLRHGQDRAIVWQGISKNEPCRPTLSIFQILEETGVEGIRNAT
jgi:hypothetical protein